LAKKDFCKKWIDKINKDYSLDLYSMAEFKNYLNKFTYSDLTDIISNVINSYIEELKLKIFIYLLNQKKSKKILLDNLTGSIRSLNVLRNIY
jgi:hypothetical protein